MLFIYLNETLLKKFTKDISYDIIMIDTRWWKVPIAYDEINERDWYTYPINVNNDNWPFYIYFNIKIRETYIF